MKYSNNLLIIIIVIMLFIFTCDSADQYIGVNQKFLPEEDDDGSGGSSPNFYSNISDAIADGLIGYWRLDETSGLTSIDETGEPKNGINNNTSIIDGKFNKSRYYEGTANTYLNIATFNSFSGGRYTFSFWANIESVITNTYFFAFSTPNLYFYISGATQFTTTYAAISRNFSYPNMANLVNTWSFFTIVFDTNTVSIYINGESIGPAQVYASTIPNGTSARFASNAAGTAGNIDTSLDDIAIWNRALTITEIQSIYNSNASLVKE